MAAYETAGGSDEWYTPQWIFDRLGLHFDLDVAAPPGGPWFTPCNHFYSEKSLDLPWYGVVWMNPPFGHQSTKRAWLSKFFDHGQGIALLPDRTSAPWWQEAASRAGAILFMNGRVKFYKPDGTTGNHPGTGTCLFAAGDLAIAAVVSSGLGWYHVGD